VTCPLRDDGELVVDCSRASRIAEPHLDLRAAAVGLGARRLSPRDGVRVVSKTED
jgi:hypothetical protein